MPTHRLQPPVARLPRGLGLKVLGTLLLIILRSPALPTVTLALAIPASVASVLAFSTSLVSDQVTFFAGQVSGSYVAIASSEYITSNRSCTRASITEAEVSYNGVAVKSLVITAEDVREFLEFLGASMLKSGGDEVNVSIGVGLARELGVGIGDVIKVCSSGACRHVKVNSVIKGANILDYSVVMRGRSNTTTVLCEEPRTVLAGRLLSSIVDEVSGILYIPSLVSLVSYVTIIFLSFRRLAATIDREVRLLHEAGTPSPIIRKYFIGAGVILAALLSLYGISLGLAALHLGIWVVRFFGVYITVRPTPSTWWPVVIVSFACFTALPAGYIASKVWRL